MPRPIWSGSISFGLVNVPVKLFSASTSQDVRFHQLRKGDGSRIRQKRVSATDGEEVPYDEIVKGYEVGPDQYVVVDPEELAALDPKATQTIDIEEFVDLDQIDPVYYEHPYYLVPDKRAEKAYALLAEAMLRTNKVAIARFVMRTKQYLAALRPAGTVPGPAAAKADGDRRPVLVLSTMLYSDEVVPVSALDGLPAADDSLVTDRELKMAESLIDSLSAERFEPEKYHDTYRQRVLELIDAKAAGETVAAPAAAETGSRVVDLMAALEASVRAAKERRAETAADADGASGEGEGGVGAGGGGASGRPTIGRRSTRDDGAGSGAEDVDEAEAKPAKRRRKSA